MRGGLRTRGRAVGHRRGHPHPGRPPRRVECRLPVPEGPRLPGSNSRGTGPAAGTAGPAGRPPSSRSAGTRPSPRPPAFWAVSLPPTAGGRWPRTSATRTSHNLAGQLYLKTLIKALGTRNVFTASTVDQRPKEISSALLFGEPTRPCPSPTSTARTFSSCSARTRSIPTVVQPHAGRAEQAAAGPRRGVPAARPHAIELSRAGVRGPPRDAAGALRPRRRARSSGVAHRNGRRADVRRLQGGARALDEHEKVLELDPVAQGRRRSSSARIATSSRRCRCRCG